MKKNFGKTIAKYYDEVVNAGYHNQKNYLSELKRIIKKDEKILELGCGTGQIIIPLTKKGIKCEGLDESTPMTKKLKAKNNKIKIYKTSLDSFKPKKTYDYTISCSGPFSIKRNEIESYILNKKHLIKYIKKFSKISEKGLLINKGKNKKNLKLKLKNNKVFVHTEKRKGNIMIMTHQLFKNKKFIGEITLKKRRYLLKDIIKKPLTIRNLKQFKLITK